MSETPQDTDLHLYIPFPVDSDLVEIEPLELVSSWPFRSVRPPGPPLVFHPMVRMLRVSGPMIRKIVDAAAEAGVRA